jgi:Rrf2 family protein
MTLRKSTHYALYAALELARAGRGAQVTVSRVARRYSIPEAVLAKVFQQLVRHGIAVGTRGTRGGYSLARSASKVTVLDVIQVFEPSAVRRSTEDADDAPRPLDDPGLVPLRKLFDEVEELTRCTYASVTLETLAGSRSVEGERLHVVSE